jgi:SAM-dependent methyltransferase
MSDTARTASHWDSDPWNTGRVDFWSQLPSVQRRQAIKESGRADGNWIDHTLQTHLAGRLPLARCLSLGCGRGHVERQWAERQAFLACDAYDLSPASIADAAQAAQQAGFSQIHYAVADIDRMELPAQHYDVVWAVAAALHFSRLEHVFAQIAQTLKPGGLFILNEYVGANRFQFDARQRQIIEACLNLLPAQYRSLLPSATTAITADGAAPPVRLQHQDPKWIVRRTADKLREGTFWSTAGRYWRRHQAISAGLRPIKETALPTERSVIAIDPSEAVRSADIIPVLQSMFDVIEYRPLGGTILQFLLADIAGNFEDEDGRKLLDMLFTIEDTLMTVGDLGSDFAYIVAIPKPAQG